ncbi:MAG TPA: hypothetical protein VFE92_13055 [Dermatophilaceae bacterium]|nr:hypothetical protein [Dermatophilaceae bacterium]
MVAIVRNAVPGGCMTVVGSRGGWCRVVVGFGQRVADMVRDGLPGAVVPAVPHQPSSPAMLVVAGS